MILDWIVFIILSLLLSVCAGAIIFIYFFFKLLVAFIDWIIDL